MIITEGTLKLKKDAGGYRHYIKTASGEHIDLRCGTPVEVQFGRYEEQGDSEVLVPGQWLAGRYEGNLSVPSPQAYFYFGYAYPTGDSMYCELPLDAVIRVR